MKLTLTQFVTIDGVYQGPGSPDEDPTDGFTRGGWMVPHMDQAFLAIASGWLDRASGLLLGRRTYEAFALAWPDMDPADPFTGRMNSLPKYVATRSGVATPWGPATVLSGDAVAQVAALKEQQGGELQLHGSAPLSQSLLAAGLIDEIRLVISPTVVGQGRRLFAPEGPALGMRVVGHQVTPGGLTVLEFEATGSATFDTYDGATATPA